MRYTGTALLVLLACVADITGSHKKSPRSQKTFHCPEQQVTADNLGSSVTWPESEISARRIASEPLCLSADKSLITRRCLSQESSDTGVWDPPVPPNCSSVQTETQQICPPSYFETYSDDALVCVLVTDPQPWYPACVPSGTTVTAVDLQTKQLNAVLETLRERRIGSVWLPVKRYTHFGPLLRKLPGEAWGKRFEPRKDFEFPWAMENRTLDENCVEMNVLNGSRSNFNIQTKDCSESLPSICVALPFNEEFPLQLACPTNYFTSRYGLARHRCFSVIKYRRRSVSWEGANNECRKSNGHLATITSGLNNRLIQQLMRRKGVNNDKCWIGLGRSEKDDGYVWQLLGNKTSSVSYVNWNRNSITRGMKGVIQPDGSWLLLYDRISLRCFVCEVELNIPQPQLSLRFDSARDHLTLSVLSAEGLWKEDDQEDLGFQCFTNIAGDFVRRITVEKLWEGHWTLNDIKAFQQLATTQKYSNLTLNVRKSVYKLNRKNKAGTYWCEGHKITTSEMIRSNIILVFAKKPGQIFALVLDVIGQCQHSPADPTICDPTFSEVFKDISKDVRNKLRLGIPQGIVTNVKPMKIINITNDGVLRIILHVRMEFTDTNELTTVYNRSLTIVRKMTDRFKEDYIFYSLRSTSGCLPSVTEGKQTPTTLNWRFTRFGTTAVSQELCMKDKNLPVLRSCLGDFVSGGYWDEPSGSCSNDLASSTTESLHALALDTEAIPRRNFIDIVQNITILDPGELTPADIYFLACVMKNLAGINESQTTIKENSQKLQVITQIINHVYRSEKEQLDISQKFLNSTNILLEALDQLLDQLSPHTNNSQDSGVLCHVSPQVVVQISDPSYQNITGLALVRKKPVVVSKKQRGKNRTITMRNTSSKDFTNYDVVPLRSDDLVNSVLELEGMEVAAWVPEELILKLMEDTNNESIESRLTGNQYTDTGPIFSLVGRKPRVVIIIFLEDVIFQGDSYNQTSVDGSEQSTVASRIVSVSIPGYGVDLPVPIPIIFKPLVQLQADNATRRRRCSFWDFSYNSSTPSKSLGGWSSDGCVYVGHSDSATASAGNVSAGLDVCVCTHLTHFAELILGPTALFPEDFSSDIDIEELIRFVRRHEKVLDVITILGCSLSLIGVVGIAATAFMFRSWRKKPGTKVLLQLSIALASQMFIMIFANLHTPTIQETVTETEIPFDYPDYDNVIYLDDAANLDYQLDVFSNDTVQTQDEEYNYVWCLIIGAFLHYSVLSGFTWMLVTAFLQFLRYVKVLGNTRPTRFLLKSMLFGWGLPFFPVLIVLLAAPSSYIHRSSPLCYPTGYSLYFGVIFPILLIVITNLVVFVMVINSVVRGPDGKLRADNTLLYSQLRLGVVLFFLLGLSWLFGLLAATGAGLIFSYLFCLSATLQGFVLFLFFVVCDPSTRTLWVSLGRTCRRVINKSNPKNLLSKSSTNNFSGQENPVVITDK